jgi:preprotein translocase subunit SecB
VARRKAALPLDLHPIQIRAVQLQDVTLKRVTPAATAEAPDNQEPTVEARMQVAPVERTEDGGTLNAVLEIRARWPGGPSPYDLRFHLAGEFVFTPEITDEVLQGFSEASAFTLLWPFAREFAADIQQRMGVPQALLPLVAPPKLRALIHLTQTPPPE